MLLKPAVMHAGHMAVIQNMMGKSAMDSVESAMSHLLPWHT